MSTVETDFNFRFKYFQNDLTLAIDQAIDGSIVPIDFIVPILTKSYVRRIDFVFASVNMVSTLDYGLIPGPLFNGVQLLRSDGLIETELFNVRRFIEFGHFADGQISQIKTVENPTENILIASVTFEPIMPVQAGTYFITRIRDDLSKLRYHRTSMLVLEP